MASWHRRTTAPFRRAAVPFLARTGLTAIALRESSSASLNGIPGASWARRRCNSISSRCPGEMREVVLSVRTENPDAALALQLLRDWDGVMAAWSVAATVFELFATEMARRLAQAKAPRSYEWALSRGFSPLLPQSGLAFRRAGSCRDCWPNSLPDGSIGRGLWRSARAWLPQSPCFVRGAAYTLQVGRGESRGRSPCGTQWAAGVAWVDLHIGPFPWGGNTNTVGQASVDPLDPLGNPGSIASLRLVIDVGAWENSRFALPGGQSGNPFSRHYADQVPLGGVATAFRFPGPKRK